MRRILVLLSAGLLLSGTSNSAEPKPDPEQEKAIAEIKKLGVIVPLNEALPHKPVKKVVLAGTAATDANLELLKHFGKLKELYLGGTGIGDAGLEQVKGLVNLEKL